jgi:phospholipid/cholesterol/gamma-HCH transport system substrate-binding protein
VIARAAALGALVLAAVIVALVLMGGGGGHRYFMEFQTAGQLVKDDDVQVGGRRVGSIKSIELTNDNQARIEVEVQEPFAPLRDGTKAVIRATSLSGVANRYIALTLPPENAKALDDKSVLKADSTTSIVDLDQLFNTLDEPTRNDLKGIIQGFATATKGRGDEAAKAAEYFNPALSTSRKLFAEVTEDEGVLTEFLVNSARTVTALAEKRDDLSSLVGNTNATAGAIAQESESLGQALDILPSTLRRANTTFVNLRATVDDLDLLVNASKPATKDLEPFLKQLRPLVASARPTIADLRKLVSRSGPDNDLVDATKSFPGLQRVASPALEHSRASLVKAQPVLEFVRPYTVDIVGWFRDFGQGAANYDANGHFARIQPIFNAFSFTENPAGGTLEAIPPQARLDNLQKGMMRRCPGSATQPATDGSNPFLDQGRLGADDCDPTQVPPGP